MSIAKPSPRCTASPSLTSDVSGVRKIRRYSVKPSASMPGENEMFYGVVQKGLDAWNSSFFCGSAAVLRRAHLMSVGGIAGTSITEDAETALELHARGYKSLYVD